MIKRGFSYFRYDMKLRWKIILVQLLVFLLPALVTISFLHRQFYTNTLNTVLESKLSLVDRTSAQLESLVGQIKGISDMISGTDLLNKVLLLDEASGGEELDTYRSILDSYMGDSGISDICIYTDEDAHFLNTAGSKLRDRSFFISLEKIRYVYWKGLMEICGHSSMVFPGYYLSEEERTQHGAMSYVKKVQYNKEGKWKEAYVVIYIEEEAIRDILKEKNTGDGEMIYVLDPRNIFVTPYVEEDYTIYAEDYENLEDIFPEKQKFYKRDYGMQDAYVCRHEIKNTDWMFIWVIPENGIVRESRSLLLKTVVSYSILLLLGMGLVSWVLWSFMKRLFKLQEQMKQLKANRPVPVYGKNGKDEIGELAESYNYMVNRVNMLVDREIQVNEELNDMKIETLRAQMDPHFLYNTLDLVRGLARQGEKEEIENVVLALSKFYRLSLNGGKRFGTVEQELEQSGYYMEIMNMRFRQCFSFAVDVSEEMMDYPIPNMIFQPLLENAIVHGILEKEEKNGCISLIGWMQEDKLHFMISDDGVGMDEETLHMLREGKKVSSKGSSVGIGNTVRRLQLIYGMEEKWVTFSSTPGRGTDVELQIPFHREESV